jgi:hypothetical protein
LHNLGLNVCVRKKPPAPMSAAGAVLSPRGLDRLRPGSFSFQA